MSKVPLRSWVAEIIMGRYSTEKPAKFNRKKPRAKPGLRRCLLGFYRWTSRGIRFAFAGKTTEIPSSGPNESKSSFHIDSEKPYGPPLGSTWAAVLIVGTLGVS